MCSRFRKRGRISLDNQPCRQPLRKSLWDVVSEPCMESHGTPASTSALLLILCVALGKLLDLSESISSSGAWGSGYHPFGVRSRIKYLKYLTYSTCPVNII